MGELYTPEPKMVKDGYYELKVLNQGAKKSSHESTGKRVRVYL